MADQDHRGIRSSKAALTIAALGVVYGDIGTSPLYAVRECFYGPHAVAPTPAHVLGVLSLIFWALSEDGELTAQNTVAGFDAVHAAWDALPSAYREAFEVAAVYAMNGTQTIYDRRNPEALERLIAGGTQLRRYPDEVMIAARNATQELLEQSASRDAGYRKIYDASASRRLVSLIKSLQDTQVLFVSATLSRSPTLKETATADHEAMIQAARDRDARTLTEVTLRHLTIPVRD